MGTFSVNFIYKAYFLYNMEKIERDKTLFELYPELEAKLIELRGQAKKLGLLGKIEFS